jgi:benzylsuccinate CoA-transferase BbsF subunit
LRGVAGRREHAAAIDEAITAWTRSRTAAEVEQELQARGVPAHVSASSRDFCADPQVRHRGQLVELPHPRFGTAVVEGPRYLLSETPGRVGWAAPQFGQDNEKVLLELLGYDKERIAQLTQKGVLR